MIQRIKTAIILMFSLLSLAFLSLGHASAQVTDLSERKIEIRYSFDGAELILFGTIGKLRLEGDYDVVVVVRGPDIQSIVRKKEKKYGIWMNSDSVVFAKAPGYYAVASTQEISKIANEKELNKYSIGFQNMTLPVRDVQTTEGATVFRDALFRGRSSQQLFRQGLDKVTLVGEGLFRTNVYLPANVPVGEFHVNAYIFQDGKMVGSNDLPMLVSKEGFERAVYDYAHNMPFFYGLTAVFIALGAGWLAGMAGLKKG